jgi:adenine-specific DNA-methyltransferase
MFDISVGLVSGANEIFKDEKNAFDSNLTINILTTKFTNTNLRERYIYCDEKSLEEIKTECKPLFDHFIENKDRLKSRKIKHFDDTNYHHWGAIRNKNKMLDTNTLCIYVACKTRQKKPFFIANSGYFDGSVLCLYPKTHLSRTVLTRICDILNNEIDFTEYNMLVNGRYSFGQRTLSNVMIKLEDSLMI